MNISEIMDLADEHAKAYYMGRGEDTRKKLQAAIVAVDETHAKAYGLLVVERDTALAKVAELEAERERSTPVSTLSGMFHSLEGIDTEQWGYHWRKGWNDALRQAMDYAQGRTP